MDVVASCRGGGQRRSAIRDATPNDFAAFFRQWPQIGRICFNGRVAEQLFRRLVLKDGGYGTLEALRPGLQTIRLGSTSPAMRRICSQAGGMACAAAICLAADGARCLTGYAPENTVEMGEIIEAARAGYFADAGIRALQQIDGRATRTL